MFMTMTPMRRMLSLRPILRSLVMQIGRQTSKPGEVFHHLVFSLDLACSILHLVLRRWFFSSGESETYVASSAASKIDRILHQ